MSSSDRRLFLTSLLALGACGFTPVYGPGGAAVGLRGAIEVAEPETRNDYDLVKRLEERLGQPAAPRFDLSYDITTNASSVGVTADNESSRTRVTGVARFAITPMDGDTPIYEGEVTSFTGFITTGTTVSAASQERDAYRRLMVALADLMVTRIMATAPDWSA